MRLYHYLAITGVAFLPLAFVRLVHQEWALAMINVSLGLLLVSIAACMVPPEDRP